MQLRNYCKWVTITGIILIWIIKTGVRPYIHSNLPIKFVLGVAPNFIGAFLIPFAAYWLYTHALFFNGLLMRFYFFSDIRIVCMFGFLLLTVNEYLQLLPVFGRTFDYFDILFSAFGLLIAYGLFPVLQRKLIMNYDQK